MAKRTPATHDYLNRVSEFISFLSVDELTLDEILMHLVLVVLSPINAEAISIRQLNSGNQAVRVGTWGMPLEMVQPQHGVYNLNEKYPSTDTLLHRRTTWINTLPDFGDDYPLLKEFPYTTGAKSFICIPIEKAGTPVAALGVFSRDAIQPNAEIESFLTAVGSVFSMYMFSQESRPQKTMKARDTGAVTNRSFWENSSNELSERQQVILRLISEDRTNLAIGELLGYSESTIRQETIKIFAQLGCTGRHQAALIYKEQVTKSKEE